jgi:hypothetical protein
MGGFGVCTGTLVSRQVTRVMKSAQNIWKGVANMFILTVLLPLVVAVPLGELQIRRNH